MRPLVVEALSIRSFRNLREADVALGPRFNVVSGDNGQGKTSLLEALYVVLTSKSFRATKIEESITFGETSSLVRARILDGDLPRTQAVALRRGGRDLRVDDKRPKSASDFATLSPVVVFHPGELTLSSGSGSERRRLLDRVSLFASPSAADELARRSRRVPGSDTQSNEFGELVGLETVALYDQMRSHPERDWCPRVKLFGGKAASSYHNAKLIIKLANDVARVINHDPSVMGMLKVVFVPNYNVSLAEAMMPAANLSEQISTAGMEASGTGNMKFALNGALTIGTLDGANIEIRDHVGKDNIIIFGLTADEVAAHRAGGYDPRTVIDGSRELAQALSAIAGGVFSPDDPDRYKGLVAGIQDHDWFMIAADFDSYSAAQRRIDDLWQKPDQWDAMAIRNTANVGWFSSDRTIRQYAREIWKVLP